MRSPKIATLHPATGNKLSIHQTVASNKSISIDSLAYSSEVCVTILTRLNFIEVVLFVKWFWFASLFLWVSIKSKGFLKSIKNQMSQSKQSHWHIIHSFIHTERVFFNHFPFFHWTNFVSHDYNFPSIWYFMRIFCEA